MENTNEQKLPQRESRETLGKTQLGIELNKAGGFGDILHVAKLAGALAEDPSLMVDVYSNQVTDQYLSICPGEFGHSLIVHSSQQVAEPDILLTTVLPTTKRKGKQARIHIEEFGYQEGGQQKMPIMLLQQV